jgi:hypothetical protein
MNVPNIIRACRIELKEQDVMERLEDRNRWPKQYPWNQPSVEAINADSTTHQSFFEKDGYLNYPECIKCYEKGQTLILSNIGYFNKDISFIQKLLNEIFKKKINCNLYFGKGSKKVSFKKHSHDYAVIVKNIYGESNWIIDGKECVLDKQNVFYIDKNKNHEVVSIKGPKLSMTIGLN